MIRMTRFTHHRAWRRVATVVLALLLTAGFSASALASPDAADEAMQHAAGSAGNVHQDSSGDGVESSNAGRLTPALTARPAVTQWFIAIIVDIGIVTIFFGIVLMLWRMLRGPHLADRVLAADAMSLHVVGLVILLALRLETEVFFDAALVVAIIGFASTLAFAQYIGNRRRAGAA